ncbi:hypothetical protein HPB52_001902 [Rhipicephalus sanguineus]|uniref:G-protein coupled receptors family 1 profile domain-containing protein n=1 Tax=Rhipicephalus sanguineus TaxID=34632 RepID=A0A9D4PTS3_RHISA|nr:hypothetical protein HPB52_001902 [Rhipicephalus sanguineus]
MRSASGTGGSSNASTGLVTQSYDVWFDVEAATTSATAAAAVVDGPTPVHLLCTSLAATVGLVLNAYILVVLFWQRQFRTANSLLLLHLAFVDSVFCLLVLTSNAVFGGLSASAEVIDASGACYVQGVLWAVVPAVAVWTLCGLSCDRYAAIASPLHYSRLVNTRRTCAFLGVSWIVAAGAAVPPLVGVCPYSYGPSRCVCVAACAGSGADLQAPASSPVGLGYALSYVWLALVFPASLIAASNLQVLLIARTHRHRIVAAIYEAYVAEPFGGPHASARVERPCPTDATPLATLHVAGFSAAQWPFEHRYGRCGSVSASHRSSLLADSLVAT